MRKLVILAEMPPLDGGIVIIVAISPKPNSFWGKNTPTPFMICAPKAVCVLT